MNPLLFASIFILLTPIAQTANLDTVTTPPPVPIQAELDNPTTKPVIVSPNISLQGFEVLLKDSRKNFYVFTMDSEHQRTVTTMTFEQFVELHNVMSREIERVNKRKPLQVTPPKPQVVPFIQPRSNEVRVFNDCKKCKRY